MLPYEDWVLELTLNGATGKEVSEFRRIIEDYDIVSSSICRKISESSEAPAKQLNNNHNDEIALWCRALDAIHGILSMEETDVVRKDINDHIAQLRAVR